MVSLFLFQAEYEIAPDEKLGEKGKEIMMKYLTPEVRDCQNDITEGMQGTPLLNRVIQDLKPVLCSLMEISSREQNLIC